MGEQYVYGGPTHGARDTNLSKAEVEYILSQLHKAKEEVQKYDFPNENIIILHLNNIGAKLSNH